LHRARKKWTLERRIQHNYNEYSFGREISSVVKTQRSTRNGIKAWGIVIGVDELKNKCNKLIPDED